MKLEGLYSSFLNGDKPTICRILTSVFTEKSKQTKLKHPTEKVTADILWPIMYDSFHQHIQTLGLSLTELEAWHSYCGYIEISPKEFPIECIESLEISHSVSQSPEEYSQRVRQLMYILSSAQQTLYTALNSCLEELAGKIAQEDEPSSSEITTTTLLFAHTNIAEQIKLLAAFANILHGTFSLSMWQTLTINHSQELLSVIFQTLPKSDKKSDMEFAFCNFLQKYDAFKTSDGLKTYLTSINLQPYFEQRSYLIKSLISYRNQLLEEGPKTGIYILNRKKSIKCKFSELLTQHLIHVKPAEKQLYHHYVNGLIKLVFSALDSSEHNQILSGVKSRLEKLIVDFNDQFILKILTKYCLPITKDEPICDENIFQITIDGVIYRIKQFKTITNESITTESKQETGADPKPEDLIQSLQKQIDNRKTLKRLPTNFFYRKKRFQEIRKHEEAIQNLFEDLSSFPSDNEEAEHTVKVAL